MKKLWQLAGFVCHFITKPLSDLYVKGSKRTRVLVKYDNKILVVKPWLGNGKWILPGGGIHRNEKSLDAAIRELREETGLIADTLEFQKSSVYQKSRLTFDYDLFSIKLDRKPQIKKQILEIVDIAWCDPKDLSEKNANPDVLQALAR